MQERAEARQGWLSALEMRATRWWGTRQQSGRRASAQQPALVSYRTHDDFLPEDEMLFYHILTVTVGETVRVCPHVRLSDAVADMRPRGRAHDHPLRQEQVDFLLCEPPSMRPLLGIELYEERVARRGDSERDRLIEEVFGAAGLPLLRLPAGRGYSPDQLSAILDGYLRGTAQHETGPAGAQVEGGTAQSKGAHELAAPGGAPDRAMSDPTYRPLAEGPAPNVTFAGPVNLNGQPVVTRADHWLKCEYVDML